MSSTPFTGFGAALADFDLDGSLDVVVANGAVKRRTLIAPETTTAEHWKTYAEPNLAYLNDGSGRFRNVSATAGAICERAEVSRGLNVGDFDNDGDLDILMTQIGGPARLFRNDSKRRGRWLIVRAIDPAHGRDALGAVVTVTAGGETQQRVILAGDSYACGREPVAHFGLGDVERIGQVVVLWPDGMSEWFAGVEFDRMVELRRGTGTCN